MSLNMRKMWGGVDNILHHIVWKANNYRAKLAFTLFIKTLSIYFLCGWMMQIKEPHCTWIFFTCVSILCWLLIQKYLSYIREVETAEITVLMLHNLDDKNKLIQSVSVKRKLRKKVYFLVKCCWELTWLYASCPFLRNWSFQLQ